MIYNKTNSPSVVMIVNIIKQEKEPAEVNAIDVLEKENKNMSGINYDTENIENITRQQYNEF